MTKKLEVVEFFYTKANGERSHRRFIELRPPSNLHLGLDVTDCTSEEIEEILDMIHDVNEVRDQAFEDAGVNNRWRSFKQEGIEWCDE